MKYSICIFKTKKPGLFEVHAYKNDELTNDGLIWDINGLIQCGINFHMLEFSDLDNGGDVATKIFEVGNITYYRITA